MKYLLIIAILILLAGTIKSCHFGNSPTGTIDTTYNTIEP